MTRNRSSDAATMVRLAALRLRKLLRAVRDPVGRRGLRRGVLAAAEHARPLATLDVGTVLDVGANRGQFALVCRMLFPRAVVHVFEPLPTAASGLRVLFSGDSAVVVHPVAIDASAGARTLHVSAKDDSSSLLPIGEGQLRNFPGTNEVASVSVETCRLSDRVSAADLTPPVLLKIDVQGNELRTLLGCQDLLRSIDWIYVETSFEELYVDQGLASDVICLLADAGFGLRSVENVSRGRDSAWAVQADLLFNRPRDAAPC